MIASWKHTLEAHGATFLDDQVADFGDAEAERRQLARGAIVADLSQLNLIQFAGADAQSFLQGQLSNDVRLLDGNNAQYTSYNTPKGRMLANGLLWQSAPNTYIFQLPASLREAIQKRLTMFVLRAKVKVSDVSDDSVRLGVGGVGAAATLSQMLGELPASALGRVPFEHGSVLRLPGDNFELLIAPEQAQAIWEKLMPLAKPVGNACWDALLIRAGIPTLLPATQEQFVAQMLNYELIGGVNFKKGCYPGQEIVARTQYLGKPKRRMYLAHIDCGDTPQPGDELFSDDLPEQATGMVVNAAPAGDGGFDVLAVIQISSAEGHALHLKSIQGPALALQALPYAIP
jgi:folate-binding protein YgfZ